MVHFFPIAIMMITNDADRHFIENLYLENAGAMYLMAYRIAKDDPAACDIVSEACIRMIEKIDYLHEIDSGKLTPYILSIVRNTALQNLRKQRTEQAYLEKSDLIRPETEAGSEADDAILSEAEIREVQAAWTRISEKSRELLRMKYLEQLGDMEIAAELHVAKNSVREYLTRARRELKEELKKGGII